MACTVEDSMRREEPLEGPLMPRETFRCPACGAEFTKREQLDDHTRVEHRTA